MRVVRGRASDRDADREVTATLLEDVAETGVPALRVWSPARQMAFGRRDTRADGYDAAREAAEERGYPAIERSVGGRAVAYTGTTLAFAHARPVEDMRRGLDERYDDAVATVIRGLETVGVDAERGEPPDSFCPGAHSVQSAGKIAGIAQRVRKGAALVSGCVLVADHEEISGVLEPVYEALSVPFDPGSVGSVARAGGDGDAETVARALESAFVDGRERTVEQLSDVS
ncbi:lipoate--protein ligase [Haloprofundus marisrubri]|uniref:Lipoate--protein ligase n=1 Tax=Haloprofundus marisrubri TaxID=1514971 RepID=A0A0W1R5Q8_9EURY|nr:lipoate--protein ligase family protein [Haloprofundus marisrubri]KTG08778.1 lipoate--protein ligase [Haloprofundus marisrubri]